MLLATAGVEGTVVSPGRGFQETRRSERFDLAAQGFFMAEARMPCVLGILEPESLHEARCPRERRSGDGDMNEANDLTVN